MGIDVEFHAIRMHFLLNGLGVVFPYCTWDFSVRCAAVHLSGGRRVVGVLRGYDTFMNVVLDNALELKGRPGSQQVEKNEIGMVVIRGNSILNWECLDKVKA